MPFRPAFMTRATWSLWLLRGDVRSGAAERDFIPQWLLRGHPRVSWAFSWSRKHARIAIKFVTLRNGQHCPRLLVRLHRVSHDPQRAVPLHGRNLHAGGRLPWGGLSAAVAIARRCCATRQTPPARARRTLAGDGVNLINLAHQPSGLGEDLPDGPDMAAETKLVWKLLRQSNQAKHQQLALHARKIVQPYSPQAARRRFPDHLTDLGMIERTGRVPRSTEFLEATFMHGC